MRESQRKSRYLAENGKNNPACPKEIGKRRPSKYRGGEGAKRAKAPLDLSETYPSSIFLTAIVTIPTLSAASTVIPPPTVITPARTTAAAIAAAATTAAVSANPVNPSKVASLMDVKVVPTGALAQVLEHGYWIRLILLKH